MPVFDAASVVESLDWDFSGTLPDGKRVPGWPKVLYNAKGVIPEPTDASIGRFLDGLKKNFVEAQQSRGSVADIGGDTTPAEMLDILNRLSGESFVKLLEDIAELFSDLCGGHPTKAQLLALPLRARVQFYAWLQAEVVNPEAVTGAGNAQVLPLPSSAAG